MRCTSASATSSSCTTSPTGGIGEPLWDHVRSYALPESLQHKLKLFASRGHVPYFKDGFFSRDSWLAVLFGQGLDAARL